MIKDPASDGALLVKREVKVCDGITVKVPSVYAILDYGEFEYFAMLRAFTATSSDMKSQLWDLGLDWEKIGDFELFSILTKTLEPEETSLLCGDLDFSKFVAYRDESGQLEMVNPEDGTEIDETKFRLISSAICKMHGIKQTHEKAFNKSTKMFMIREERERIEKAKNEPYKPWLIPLVSAMSVYSGFKYKPSELDQCGIYEFMDAVKHAQIYVQSTALLQGSMSGMIDTSKIDRNQFDWMRDNP